MNEDYLFSIIGKLYLENLQFQRFVPQLQSSLQEKDQEIGLLRLEIEEKTKQWITANAKD